MSQPTRFLDSPSGHAAAECSGHRAQSPPVAQLDYEAFNQLGDRRAMTGLWLEHRQSCSAPEIACVFNRAGIPSHLVVGFLEDEEERGE